MGWVPKFLRRQKEPQGHIRELSFDEFLELWGGLATSKSGASVTHQTALECATSFACARAIANGVAQVPFKLFQETEKGRHPAKKHSLYDLMVCGPNEWQTSFEFRFLIAIHLVFCGNAFVWINRVNDKVVELLPFEPGVVTVQRDGWRLQYEISTVGGGHRTVGPESMWHLRGPSWNGWMGLDAVRLAREAIGLAMSTEEFGAKFFANGAKPGGILTTEKDLSDKPTRDDLRKSWNMRHQGASKAFNVALLWGGLKWQQIGVNNEESQLIDQRKFQVEEICRAFNVKPIVVGFSDKASTYASAEAMFSAHKVQTMDPWYALIEQSGSKFLLSKEERAQGYYLKFLSNGLLRSNSKERAAFYKELFATGSVTPNEIRELEEMNPIKGGDKTYVPSNFTEVGTGQGEPNEDETQGPPNPLRQRP